MAEKNLGQSNVTVVNNVHGAIYLNIYIDDQLISKELKYDQSVSYRTTDGMHTLKFTSQDVFRGERKIKFQGTFTIEIYMNWLSSPKLRLIRSDGTVQQL